MSGGRGKPPRRKRRTREHVLADLSENHLERLVLLCGHILRRPKNDYAVDVAMFHFSEDGQGENGEVRFQLKATDRLDVIEGGGAVSVTVRSGDLHYWALEIFPFVLIVFDAVQEEAYFLEIQDYVSRLADVVDPSREHVNVRIPISNRLTVQSIERFRRRSLATVSTIQRHRDMQGDDHDARKPR